MPMKIDEKFIKNNNERLLLNISKILMPEQATNAACEDNKTTSRTDSVTSEELIILSDIDNRPYVPRTERYKTIHINNKPLSAGKGSRKFAALIRKRMIVEHEINLGGRGRNTKFDELSNQGYVALGREPKKGIGRGADFEHGFWQYYIREKVMQIKNVMKASIEGRLRNNKYVDVLVETPDKKVGIEVAMTADHEKVNIEKDLDGSCDLVLVGCKNESVLSAVADIVEVSFADHQQRLTVCLVQKLVANAEKHLT